MRLSTGPRREPREFMRFTITNVPSIRSMTFPMNKSLQRILCGVYLASGITPFRAAVDAQVDVTGAGGRTLGSRRSILP